MADDGLIQEGKVKKVYSTEDPGVLEFVFTDNISVFDKVIPSTIPGKGESLCRTSAHWFMKGEERGIRNHFLEQPEGNRMRVRRVEVIRDYDSIDEETTNYLIPIEAICRYFMAGSLHDRVNRGEVSVESLGFPSGHTPEYGERLPEPFFEVTTKLEPVDRRISKSEAMEMSGLLDHEFEEIHKSVISIDSLINGEVEKRGLLHVDGKKEFAFDDERRLMLIDTFGTADEDRFWDKALWEEKGECVELSKEFVRQHYRRTGYLNRLEKAREKGEEEPPIPPLEPEFIEEVRKLYIDLFERLTGKSF